MGVATNLSEETQRTVCVCPSTRVHSRVGSVCACTRVHGFVRLCVHSLMCAHLPVGVSPAPTSTQSLTSKLYRVWVPEKGCLPKAVVTSAIESQIRKRTGRQSQEARRTRRDVQGRLTLKAPGLTSKLQPLKPPAAEAFGTATLPESAGHPWVRRLRDDHAGHQPHVLLLSPAQPSPTQPSISPVPSPFFGRFAILQATSEATMKRSSNTAKMRGRRTLSFRPSLMETTEEAPVADLPP